MIKRVALLLFAMAAHALKRYLAVWLPAQAAMTTLGAGLAARSRQR